MEIRYNNQKDNVSKASIAVHFYFISLKATGMEIRYNNSER